MIQLASIHELKAEDINKLVNIVKPELDRKVALYNRYRRKESDTSIIGVNSKEKTIVPFEKYIIDMATGYLGGREPSYEVESSEDEQKISLIKKLLNKIQGNEEYKKSMQILINYITNYNDDGAEHYQLVQDLLITGSCYEILYENQDNEIVYSRVSPLQTQAIWDYSVPRNLIGVVQLYEETDINNTQFSIVELTDENGTRKFKSNTTGTSAYEEITETDENGNIENHNWGDVPFTCTELPDAIGLFEPVLNLIEAYQDLVQQTKETFKYNNEAKLKITGYTPDEEMLIENEKGELVENKKRIKQDEAILNAKIFYTPDDGDIAWIEKNIEDGAIQNTLKTYIDLIMMNTGVPQTTDLGFTKADNASAIDRKFFSLEQMTAEAMQLLKMAYKRRWELVFNRLNIKGAKFDFRDVIITLNKNIPSNESEVVDMYMKLRGLISDETIISRLPLNFDSNSEINKMEVQEENELNKEVDKASKLSNIGNTEKEI